MNEEILENEVGKIKVTIIIPVYNVEKYLRQCLDSVVNQTFKDLEIIVVNDCSPDNSLEIIKEYTEKDERFVVLNQPENKGQGVARNLALDVANGEYIMFLDSDDWLELDACQKAYYQISKNKNEMVFFNLYSWKERKGKLGKRKLNNSRLKPFKSIMNKQHINLRDVKGNWLPAAWTPLQIYSKEFLDENNIRFSDDLYAEDLPFFIKAIIYSKDISILDEPLYNYRKKIGNFTIDYTRFYDSAMAAKEKARNILKESTYKDYFLEKYYIYEIGSGLQAFKTFSKVNKSIRKGYYKKIKTKFSKIALEVPQSVLIQSSEYELFDLILRCENYEEFMFKKFVKRFCKNLLERSGIWKK